MNGETLEKIRKYCLEKQLDALLLTQSADVYYVCGFSGSGDSREVEVLITTSNQYVVVDGRNTNQATAVCVGFEIINCSKDRNESIVSILEKENIKKIGIDEQACSIADARGLADRCERIVGNKIECVPVASFVLRTLRAQKSTHEIVALQKACAITDQAFSWIRETIKPGFTERKFAWMLEKALREFGAEKLSFESIIASGENSASPHHHTSDRVLQIGDAVVCDFGAVYEGYYADMTRTVFLGKPLAAFCDVYEVVLAAQKKAAEELKAGQTGATIDAIAREYIATKGYGEYFNHGLGHGIGLQVHEYPYLNARNIEPLCAGAVVTVEPGIYISGKLGVRIEDDYLVTQDAAQRLTLSVSALSEMICG